MELISYWYLLSGANFSPNRVAGQTDLEFTTSNEVGAYWQRGGRSGIMEDGQATIEADTDIISYSDLFTERDHLLNTIEQNIGALRTAGLEHAVVYCTFEYETQCNLEFDPQRLRRLVNLDIVFAVTCYRK